MTEIIVIIVFVLLSLGGFIMWQFNKRHKPIENKTIEQKDVELKVSSISEVSWKDRLGQGLAKTRHEVWQKISSISGRPHLTDDDWDNIEEVLYTSDMQPSLVQEILESLKKLKTSDLGDGSDWPEKMLKEVHKTLFNKMASVQTSAKDYLFDFKPNTGLKVIMIIGVNGAGKTTTIGKIATKLKNSGAKVVVGACDTFRAAAVEQLEVWCKRAQVDIIKMHEGADPSGVAYEAVAHAKSIGADYCIIDTAGRLHNKSNLMDELKKTKKVMSKVLPEAPHEVLLVIDAITGQNALKQAEEFHKALDLTGLIFTKCDGSAKAGSAVGIVAQLKVPIIYIGVGEKVEDLNKFELQEYLEALLG